MLTTDGPVLVLAGAGTGKTAAFALPILDRLAADRRMPMHKGCRALVLSPTRELANQIAESFRTYGRFLDLRVAVIYGGVAHRPQQTAMSRGVDVLVATPGRLLDHVAERNVILSGTEIFVLDEADQMLDLGFMKPIRKIVSMLASKRQNLFFSATMPHEIGALAAELLVEPKRVEIAPAATTVERVEQRVILVEQTKKRALLAEMFADAAMSRTLVFTRTKRGADKVTQFLEGAGISAAAIHGNKSQQQRERALESFRQSKTRVLVATDIAARGIDIDLVSHVVNFELPEVPEQYVHRIGRTARAGATGVAISFCDNEERGLLRDIERTTRQQIRHEDRRNDATLVATAIGERSMPRSADGGRDRRQGGGQRNGFSGGGRQDDRGGARGETRGARGPRPAGEGRPAHRGEQRPAHRGVDDRNASRGNERGRENRDQLGSGLISAGGWSPMLGEPPMSAPRRDDDRSGRGHAPRSNGPRDHSSRGPSHRADGPRGNGHRGHGPNVSGEHPQGDRGPRRNDDRRPAEGRSEGRPAHRGEGRPEHRGEARGPNRGEARGPNQGAPRGDNRNGPRGGGKPAFGRPANRNSDGGRGRGGFKAGV